MGRIVMVLISLWSSCCVIHVLGAFSTITLYNVFPTNVPIATTTLPNQPSVTIIPTAVGKDGRTTYIYDIMGAGFTYEGTLIEGSGYVEYSAWPPTSLLLKGAGIYQSCTFVPGGAGRCVEALPGSFRGITTTTTYRGTALPFTTMVVDLSAVQNSARSGLSIRLGRNVIIGVVVGCVVLLALVAGLCFMTRRRRSAPGKVSSPPPPPIQTMQGLQPNLIPDGQYTPFQPYNAHQYPQTQGPPLSQYEYPNGDMYPPPSHTSIPMPQPALQHQQSQSAMSFHSAPQSFTQPPSQPTNPNPYVPPGLPSPTNVHPHGHEQITIGANNITQLSWSNSPASDPRVSPPTIIRTDTTSTSATYTPLFYTPPTSPPTIASNRECQGYFPAAGPTPVISSSFGPAMYPSDSKAHLRQQLRNSNRPPSAGSFTQTTASAAPSSSSSTVATTALSPPVTSTTSQPSSSSDAPTPATLTTSSAPEKAGRKGEGKGGFTLHNPSASLSEPAPPEYSL